MHDRSISEGNDRDEPVVIQRARPQDRAVHLVFDDHNAAVRRLSGIAHQQNDGQRSGRSPNPEF